MQDKYYKYSSRIFSGVVILVTVASFFIEDKTISLPLLTFGSGLAIPGGLNSIYEWLKSRKEKKENLF